MADPRSAAWTEYDDETLVLLLDAFHEAAVMDRDADGMLQQLARKLHGLYRSAVAENKRIQTPDPVKRRPRLTPWQRIVQAADRGTGLRLSAEDVSRLEKTAPGRRRRSCSSTS